MLTHNPPRAKIIVFGIAFCYPLAGITWQFLHYLIGLRRLGCDVYYVEDSGRYVYDPTLNDFTSDATANIASIAPILESHGFANRWAFRGCYDGGRCYGMSEDQLHQLYRDADAFLNVTGAQELRDEHLAIPRRIYVETDPVVSQIKAAEGDPKTITELAGHDTHFTYGENIGHPDCLLPVVRFNWLPTRQPVILDFWRNGLPPGDTYNTIATWKNKGKDIIYNGQTYHWSKDLEFMKFIDLPGRSNARFELAVGVDAPTQTLLLSNNWRIANSSELSRDFNQYRNYIHRSRGEFTVAKDQNIRLRSGWFSDRSCCYLASARPVITQDTAFDKMLPTGQGLFSFRTIDDILTAIDVIESDYPAASRAAAEIAAEYFAAERVLASLMRRAGI